MNRADILTALANGGLEPVSKDDVVYAYADGPTAPESPVQSEWLLLFRFEADALAGFSIEEHLVGP